MNYELVDFEKDVISASSVKPVLVDFWAAWCGPCRVLGPTLEALSAEQSERWTLVKVDTEQHADISSKYDVRGIPNVKLFVDGEVVDEFTGALPERALREWIDKAIPNPLDEDVRQAVAMLATGETLAAREKLQAVLDAAPGHIGAAAQLARSIVLDDPTAARDLVAEIYENSAEFEIAESVRTLASLLRFLPDGAELSEAEVRADFLDAIRAVYAKEFDAAIEKLIEVVRRDRYYEDDAARKIIIALFKLLGEDNPITLRHRRSFDGALY